MSDLLSLMRHNTLFRGLSDSQLERLAQIMRREQYHKGQAILEQDSAGDSMYVIASGQVGVRMHDARGAARTALYLGAGQLFGEVALLDRGARSATIVATQDDTVVYALPRDSFEQLCSADNALGYLMMRNLALDLAFKLRHQNLDAFGLLGSDPGGS
jgi:CRP-like cAMP-binding protein